MTEPPNPSDSPGAPLFRRIIQLRRSRRVDAESQGIDSKAGRGVGEPSTERRLAQMEERLERLESALEGLQDALHRQAIRERQRIEQLERTVQPAEIRRSLSEDARRRGL
jgi:hypothetical protein